MKSCPFDQRSKIGTNKVRDGVGTVAKLFKETEAGPWSALQS